MADERRPSPPARGPRNRPAGGRAPSAPLTGPLVVDEATSDALKLFNARLGAQAENEKAERRVQKAAKAKDDAAGRVRNLEGDTSATADQRGEAAAAYRAAVEAWERARNGDADPTPSTPATEEAPASDEEPTSDESASTTDDAEAEVPAAESEVPAAESEPEALAAEAEVPAAESEPEPEPEAEPEPEPEAEPATEPEAEPATEPEPEPEAEAPAAETPAEAESPDEPDGAPTDH